MKKKTIKIAEWLTAKESAEYANVTRMTIYNWVDKGLLNPITIGKYTTLYSVKELDKLKKM